MYVYVISSHTIHKVFTGLTLAILLTTKPGNYTSGSLH